MSYVEGAVARLNTFWLTGVLERTHELHFSSTAPKKLRLHLRDVTPAQWMVVKVYYGGVPNRVDAYVNGVRVAAATSAAGVTSGAEHGLATIRSTRPADRAAQEQSPVDLMLAPVGLSAWVSP